MSIFIVICLGLFVGFIAKAITPGPDPGGFIITALLGIGGALVASFIGRGIGWYSSGQTADFVAAVFGSMLILFVYRLFRESKSSSV
ncbi:MAG: GlsB/YeaQ/YmgE family stress response membrane protein [Proteobacteria bacterium]|nr:GlsB/YeaQ/YmgE family stress response membrane protein [Pseudomonadota bacterium]